MCKYTLSCHWVWNWQWKLHNFNFIEILIVRRGQMYFALHRHFHRKSGHLVRNEQWKVLSIVLGVCDHRSLVFKTKKSMILIIFYGTFIIFLYYITLYPFCAIFKDTVCLHFILKTASFTLTYTKTIPVTLRYSLATPRTPPTLNWHSFGTLMTQLAPSDWHWGVKN